MTRPVHLLALLPLVGCAYFNGVYNAHQAAKRGDKLARAGRTSEAVALYTTAAEKAETVLVHHAQSRWIGDALFIAGWSWAMAAKCDRAEPRLVAFLTRTREAESRLARATLALAVCRIREHRYAPARALLAPLTKLRDSQVATDASLWAARASVALGQPDSARVYLRGTNAARAEWHLVEAFLASGQYAPAESLLARRASRGDYRPDVLDVLRTLWDAGRATAVQRIVDRYDRTHTAAEPLARLHLLVGELSLTAGSDSSARMHFAAAQRLSRDTAVVREASAQLTVAELRRLTSLVDVQNVIARGRGLANGGARQRRLDDNLLLLEMLHDQSDHTGASLFLAAEVARDSLRARALAHALFKQVAALPESPLASKALLAAGELEPDSADIYRRRAREQSSVTPSRLRSDSAGGASIADRAQSLLVQRWTSTAREYEDSLRKLHPEPAPASTSPDTGAAAAGDAPHAHTTPPR
jgi:hypothetical protein